MTASPIISVSELTGAIKHLLEASLPDVTVRGEVSNVRRQASGHIYFSLKDDGAQIKAVLFKFAADAKSKAVVENGRQLVVRGRLSVYEPQGTYSIVVQSLEEDGVGELQRRFEALKQKLSEEGLFDPENRKSIPALPRHLAVVTSSSGAALQDFLGILKRRGWAGKVSVFNTRVQGAEAIDGLVAQIERAGSSDNIDLLVVTRGGGSLEDLWAFNEEAVVRAVAACPLPVISAVGHEIDFVLTDFAADWRAETPSGAAERISSAYSEFREHLENLDRRLVTCIDQSLSSFGQRVSIEEQRLKAFTPQHRLERLEMLLDDRENRMTELLDRNLANSERKLALIEQRFVQASPKARIERLAERITSLGERLETCSAHRTLQRGFAMVKDGKGRVLSSQSAAAKSRRFEVEFHDGNIWAAPEKDPDQMKLDF